MIHKTTNPTGGTTAGLKEQPGANKILAYARRYFQIGWNLTPLKFQSKEPLIPWERFQHERITEEELKQLFKPGCNIGVVCGKISKLVVLDVDGITPEIRDFLKDKPGLKETARVKTSRGWHFYFSIPDDVEIPTVKNLQGLQGLEVRGEGSYVVAPPSLHPSGIAYKWSLPTGKFEVHPIPDWLLDSIAMHKEFSKEGDKLYKTILQDTRPLHEGERNSTLCSLAGRLKAGGLSKEETRNLLLAINKERCIPPLQEKELLTILDSVFSYPDPPREKAKVELIKCSTIKPEAVTWLWEGYIPCGALNLAGGDPGHGKSTFALELAARVSRGQLEGEFKGTPQDVLILSAEDSPTTTIIPRLIAAGADLERVSIVKTAIALPYCLSEIEKNLGTARLLVLDPFEAYLPEGVNPWRNPDLRRVLAPVSEFAERTNIAILIISHLNKRRDPNVIYRYSDSVAKVAAARSAFVFVRDPDNSETFIFVQTKNNLGPQAMPIKYRIEGTVIKYEGISIETQRLVWLGKAEVDVTSLLNQTREEREVLQEAIEFLEATLSEGPRSSNEVINEAKELGISLPTLKRAKRQLGVVSCKQGFKSGWTWELPKRITKRIKSAEEDHVKNMILFEGDDPLRAKNFTPEEHSEACDCDLCIPPGYLREE